MLCVSGVQHPNSLGVLRSAIILRYPCISPIFPNSEDGMLWARDSRTDVIHFKSGYCFRDELEGCRELDGPLPHRAARPNTLVANAANSPHQLSRSHNSSQHQDNERFEVYAKYAALVLRRDVVGREGSGLITHHSRNFHPHACFLFILVTWENLVGGQSRWNP